jgi:glycosyltransferase involved in cell wall biosynthesis
VPSVVIDVERLKHIHTGLGQFSLHLSHAMLDATDADFVPTFLVRQEHQKYYADRSASFLDVTTWRRSPVARLTRAARCSIGIRESCDVWHTTHQDSKCLPLDRDTPLVLTIHDLNVLREKKPATVRRRLALLQQKVDRATILTTASQFAASEIREHLDVEGKEIVIVPHGVCVDPASEQRSRRPAFLPDGPFLFTIGDITPKKNFHVLVDLVEHLIKSGRPDMRLVIAGSKRTDYASQIERTIRDKHLADRVILPGTVTDEERSWLYQNCEAFLFPSLSEGFGMPVLEAMRCGRPVFTSNSTSLPEVGGSLAFYWNDYAAESMAAIFEAGMKTVRRDSQYSNTLREHASQYTWKRAAEGYLSLYRRVLSR